MRVRFSAEDGFFKDLFLTVFLVIISIGLYLPWGLTKVRKRVWSHTTVGEDRLYYLGKASEILKGYLFLLGVGLILAVSFLGYSIYGAQSDITIPVPVIVALVFFAAVTYFALLYKIWVGGFKYQVNRTMFKGLRFHTDMGTIGEQWRRYYLWGFITVIFFGIPAIYFRHKVDKLKYSSLRYGTEKFQYYLSFGDFFKLNIVLSIQISVGYMIVAGLNVAFAAFGKESELASFIALGTLGFFGLYAMICQVNFQKNLFKLRLTHTVSDNIRFTTNIKTSEVFKVAIVNYFISILSLGLAYPIVLANNIRLYANSISIVGLEGLKIEMPQNVTNADIADYAADNFDLDVLDIF